jgi:hypothetical protein
VNQLSDARQRLHKALSPILAEGRVHPLPPSQIVSPCIYIETPVGSLSVQGQATLVTANFPVVIVVDGDQKSQVLTLDELIARVWDAIRTVDRGNPTSWSPGSLDVGGVSQRSATVIAEIVITARTLCDPPIVT